MSQYIMRSSSIKRVNSRFEPSTVQFFAFQLSWHPVKTTGFRVSTNFRKKSLLSTSQRIFSMSSNVRISNFSSGAVGKTQHRSTFGQLCDNFFEFKLMKISDFCSKFGFPELFRTIFLKSKDRNATQWVSPFEPGKETAGQNYKSFIS